MTIRVERAIYCKISILCLLSFLYIIPVKLNAQESKSHLKPQSALESYNKKMFKWNDIIYKYSIDHIYNFSTSHIPIEALWIIKTIGQNYIDTPSDIILSTLDFDLEAVLISFWRFTLNSSLGLFGIFDIASPLGLMTTPKSLDMILEKIGIPEGSYIILPIIGPSVTRSMFNDIFKFGFGLFITSASLGSMSFMPLGYMIGCGLPYVYTMPVLAGISTPAIIGLEFKNLPEIKEDSFEYYQAVKNWYLQRNRANIIRNKEQRGKPRLISDNIYVNNNHLFRSDLDRNDDDVSVAISTEYIEDLKIT